MQTWNASIMRMFATVKAMRLGVGLLLGILVVPSLAMAANHYVRAGATGNGSGSDWTNAYTDTPSSFIRGDKYYFATGTYSGAHLNTAESGAAVIAFQTATVSDHGTNVGWSNSYAGQVVFGQFQISTGFWTFNGVHRATLSSGYGMKVNPPASCASGYNCPDFWLLGNAGNISNIMIEYVDMPGYGQNNPTAENQFGFFCVRGVPGPASSSFSNVTISHNYIHDMGTGGTPILTGLVNGLTITDNYIARNTSTSAWHSEAWSDRGSSNVVVANNVFEDIRGSGVLVSLNATTIQNSDNWRIYGNVFWQKTVGNYIGNGVIACLNNNVCSDVYIYNNTIVGFGGTSSHNGVDWSEADPSSTNIQVKNNLWYNDVDVAPQGPVNSDYNYYINCSNVPSESHIQTGSTNVFNDLAGGDFHLVAETKDGLHLNSPYDVDPDGVKRGSDNSIWSRGAYQFSTGSSPDPPSSLTVSVH